MFFSSVDLTLNTSELDSNHNRQGFLSPCVRSRGYVYSRLCGFCTWVSLNSRGTWYFAMLFISILMVCELKVWIGSIWQCVCVYWSLFVSWVVDFYVVCMEQLAVIFQAVWFCKICDVFASDASKQVKPQTFFAFLPHVLHPRYFPLPPRSCHILGWLLPSLFHSRREAGAWHEGL